MTLRLNWTLLLLSLALTAPIGCGDDDDMDTKSNAGDREKDGGGGGAGAKADSGSKPSTGGGDELEVAGEWTSEFGDETIRDDDWNGSVIVEFDNDDNVAYTQSHADAMFSPSKFNKLVWTEPTDEGFFYCTVDFGLDSLADAKASEKTADDENPEDMGCGGMFPWTKLEPL